MNRRGQLVILAFLIAVAAYIVVVWRAQSTPHPAKNPGNAAVSPTPSIDPTVKWATYTSTAPNITVKYPAGWSVLRQPLPAIISNKTDIQSQTPDTVFLLIDSRPGSSLESCYAQTNYNKSDYTYVSKKVNANGHAGNVYTIDPKSGSKKTGYATAYLFVQKGRCYDLALASMSAAARDQNTGLAQTIAGTLKF
jgi:hypothetical protein